MLAALVGPAPPAASGGHAATPHNPAAWFVGPDAHANPGRAHGCRPPDAGNGKEDVPSSPAARAGPTGSASSGPLRAQRASCGRSRLVPRAGVPLAAASCASRRPCDQVVAGRTCHQDLQLVLSFPRLSVSGRAESRWVLGAWMRDWLDRLLPPRRADHGPFARCGTDITAHPTTGTHMPPSALPILEAPANKRP